MLTTFFRTMKADTSGATAVEYGLIVALIVVAMIVSLQAVADVTIGTWQRVETASVAAMGA
ncbi:Flp family type IVb pilin [Erythrobacter sp. NFXS35]|uniref:Flp family type IVb pilin n=1 Tax=Erythrobacter sp. NFXS35 TaxID=2818436 RepID=UPI0032DEEAE7